MRELSVPQSSLSGCVGLRCSDARVRPWIPFGRDEEEAGEAKKTLTT